MQPFVVDNFSGDSPSLWYMLKSYRSPFLLMKAINTLRDGYQKTKTHGFNICARFELNNNNQWLIKERWINQTFLSFRFLIRDPTRQNCWRLIFNLLAYNHKFVEFEQGLELIIRVGSIKRRLLWRMKCSIPNLHKAVGVHISIFLQFEMSVVCLRSRKESSNC